MMQPRSIVVRFPVLHQLKFYRLRFVAATGFKKMTAYNTEMYLLTSRMRNTLDALENRLLN